MLFLLLAIFSSAMVSIFMRLGEKRTQNIALLAVNYMMCTALSAVFVPWSQLPENGLGLTAALGIGNGVLYLASFALLQWNVRTNGVVLSSTFMKLGLLVTMAVSVCFYAEVPAPVQALGFFLAVAAIVLINYRKGSAKGFRPGLVWLLLCGGMADAMSKIFEESVGSGPAPVFLLWTFFIALLLCLGLMVKEKQRPGKRELLYGMLIGIPNFFSTRFLLGALGSLSAVLVYPAYSVGTILVVTLIGVLAFREKLSKQQWFALGLILIALVLLNS